MAKIVTVSLVVDEDNDDIIERGLSVLFEHAERDWLIDWRYTDSTPLPVALADAIVNDTYGPGDAFELFVYFSAHEAFESGNGSGFWSNEYGWTTRDLATRFTAGELAAFHAPHSGADDVVVMAYPHKLYCWVVYYLEEEDAKKENYEQAQKFFCWAEGKDHAIEQALNADPGIKVCMAEQIA